ncbi:MAG: EAL domain-containing protein [Chloroflexota bacterium]|nr:EAL domain-containing protein [Chloroflexota bacterium]
MSTDTRALRISIAALLVAVVGIVIGVLPRWHWVSPYQFTLALVLVATGVLLERLASKVGRGARTAGTLAIDLAIVIAYPPPIAIVTVAAVSVAVLVTGRLSPRRGTPSLEWSFDASIRTLAAAIGCLILVAAGWDPLGPMFASGVAVVWLVVTGAVMYLIRLVTARGVKALRAGAPIGRTIAGAGWRRGQWRALLPVLAIAAGLSLAVAIGSGAWVVTLLSLVALSLVLLGIDVALGRSGRRSSDGPPGDDAARTPADSLAEAQRIARLGSWDWDVTTGRILWSDEVFRILGYQPRAFVPTTESFGEWVKSEDATRVRAVFGDALANRTPFSIDHDIVQPTGQVRTVHQQGEVIVDELGVPMRVIGTMHDITDRKAVEERLAYRAFHDPLTDLPNRALFTDRLDRALQSPVGAGEPTGSAAVVSVAVIFLDLDGFKAINDSLGHEAGDVVLIQTAERLRESLRPADVVARFGGDEFTILLTTVTGPREARRLADRILSRLREPLVIDGREAMVSASLGIAFGRPGEATAIELLRDADAALYQAKLSGKNRSLVFETRMNADAVHRTSLQYELQRAVERGEMRLHFQPEVDLATGLIVGTEALVRWQHPVHGLIPPGSFLGLAEATGLIVPIGEWVIAEACQQAATWHRLHPDIAPATISVNVSPSQAIDGAFISRVEATLRNAGLRPSQLVVEIGAEWFDHASDLTGRTITPLRKLGVRVALDEFGHGLTPITLLQDAAIDRVKLARPLMRQFTADPRASTIATSIATLCRALGIDVAAEGLENGEQVAHARAIGASFGQGYVFSPAVPAEAIGNLLGQGHVYDVSSILVPKRQATVTRLRVNE